MARGRLKYGLWWNYENNSDAEIELTMIRKGGKFFWEQDRHYHGESLFHHYRELQRILWPEDDFHRWSDLQLHTMLENEVSVFMGSKDSGKTFSMSKFVLCDFWAYPKDTLWLISSTEFRGSELRIWGSIKNLYNRAKTRFPELEGTVLEYLHAIVVDKIDDDREFARSLQRGLVLVPAKKGGQNAGISAFIGAKAPRLRHCGDECSLMSVGFLDAYSNWHGKENFKGIMSGNPTDLLDPLCMAARPAGGWDGFQDTQKTQTWRSEFFDACVLALDGRDSPNNDFPDVPKPRYPYLISRKGAAAVARSFGQESWQYQMMVCGKPNKMLASKRVITEQLCKQHGAFDAAIWGVGKRTIVVGLDPAYGGGDRCVCVVGEFGKDLDAKTILKIWQPEIIPISVISGKEPEDQITDWLKLRLIDLGCDPKNCFYDSFGKGTLGNALARVFGYECPVPVDSGGRPTARPVRSDLTVREKNGSTRPIRGDEYYSKRVSQIWYDMRLCIESGQVRELPRNAMEEGCLRIFEIVSGNKVEIESKADMKERTGGKSPDLMDATCIMLEGAIQRGFKIERLGPDEETKPKNNLEEIRGQMHSLWKSKLPAYA